MGLIFTPVHNRQNADSAGSADLTRVQIVKSHRLQHQGVFIRALFVGGGHARDGPWIGGGGDGAWTVWMG